MFAPVCGGQRLAPENSVQPGDAMLASVLVADDSTMMRRIILDEQRLWSVLTQVVEYYNLERPHRALRLETPVPALRPVEESVRSWPVLGGLHHVYERAA